MFSFLKKLFQSKKITFDHPRLKAGAQFISKECEYLMQKGEPPIIYHITDVNKEGNSISYYTSYKDKENGRKTVSLADFNTILGY